VGVVLTRPGWVDGAGRDASACRSSLGPPGSDEGPAVEGRGIAADSWRDISA